MSWVLASMLVQAAAVPPAPTAPTADDAVVIGQRLKQLRLITKRDRKTGAVRCVFKRSSGDAAFDTGVCTAVLRCAQQAQTEAQMVACVRSALSAMFPTMPFTAE